MSGPDLIDLNCPMRTMRVELALIVGIVFFCCWCAYIIVNMNSSVTISTPSSSSTSISSLNSQQASEQQQQQLEALNNNRTIKQFNNLITNNSSQLPAMVVSSRMPLMFHNNPNSNHPNQFVINKQQQQQPLLAVGSPAYSFKLPRQTSAASLGGWQDVGGGGGGALKQQQTNSNNNIDYSSIRLLDQNNYLQQQNRAWQPSAAGSGAANKVSLPTNPLVPYNQPAEASYQQRHLTWLPGGSHTRALSAPLVPGPTTSPANEMSQLFVANNSELNNNLDPNPDAAQELQNGGEEQDGGGGGEPQEADAHNPQATDLVDQYKTTEGNNDTGDNNDDNDNAQEQPDASSVQDEQDEQQAAADVDDDNDNSNNSNSNDEAESDEPNREYEEQVGRRSFSEDLSDSNERDKHGNIVSIKRKHLINGKPVVDLEDRSEIKRRQQRLKKLKKQRKNLPNPLMNTIDEEQSRKHHLIVEPMINRRMDDENNFDKIVEEIDRHKKDEEEREKKKLINNNNNNNSENQLLSSIKSKRINNNRTKSVESPYELEHLNQFDNMVNNNTKEDIKQLPSTTVNMLTVSRPTTPLKKLIERRTNPVILLEPMDKSFKRNERVAADGKRIKNKGDLNLSKTNKQVDLNFVGKKSPNGLGAKRTKTNETEIREKILNKNDTKEKNVVDKDDDNDDNQQGEEELDQVEEVGEKSKDLEPRRKKDLHSHRLKESLEAQQWDDDSRLANDEDEQKKRDLTTNKSSVDGASDLSLLNSDQDQVAESAQQPNNIEQTKQSSSLNSSEQEEPEAEEEPNKSSDDQNGDEQQQEQKQQQEGDEEIEFNDLDFMVDSKRFPFMNEPDVEVSGEESKTNFAYTSLLPSSDLVPLDSVDFYREKKSHTNNNDNVKSSPTISGDFKTILKHKQLAGGRRKRFANNNGLIFDDDDDDNNNHYSSDSTDGYKEDNNVVYPAESNKTSDKFNDENFVSFKAPKSAQLPELNLNNNISSSFENKSPYKNNNNNNNDNDNNADSGHRQLLSNSSDYNNNSPLIDLLFNNNRTLAHDNAANEQNKVAPNSMENYLNDGLIVENLSTINNFRNNNHDENKNKSLIDDSNNNNNQTAAMLSKRMDGQEDIAVEILATPPGQPSANASFLIESVPEQQQQQQQNNTPMSNYYQTMPQMPLMQQQQFPVNQLNVEQQPQVTSQQYQGSYDQSENPAKASASKSAKKKVKYHKSKKSKLYEGKHKAAKAYKTKKKSKYKKGSMKKKKLYDKKKAVKDYKDFKGSTRGKKGKKGQGHKGAKKGALYFHDKGYKKKGFKKNYQKVETGDHKTYFDEFRDKDHSKKWKDYNDKHHYSQKKKWSGNDRKKYKNYALKEYLDKKHGHGSWNEKGKSKYVKALKHKKESEKKLKNSYKKKKKKKKKKKDKH